MALDILLFHFYPFRLPPHEQLKVPTNTHHKVTFDYGKKYLVLLLYQLKMVIYDLPAPVLLTSSECRL